MVGHASRLKHQPAPASRQPAPDSSRLHVFSLASFLFFATLCVLTLGVRVPASRRGWLHTKGGLVKPLLWAGLVVLCMLPHNSVFLQYFEAARAGGALFLLLQLVIILDLVLTHNEHYLSLDDAASRAKLVLGALVCNAAAVAGIACMYVYLWKTQRDLAFITVTLLLYVLFTLVSLLPGVHAGIFTSGAVGAYATYLCSTAILSDPEHTGSTPRWLQAVGFAIAMLAIVHSTLSLGSSHSGFDVAPSSEQLADVDEDGEPRSVHPLAYSFFHFVFALGCMYSAMLFTSWSNADAYSQWSVDKGTASMWVKIGCEWAVAVLYLWIMLAPLVFASRDFTP